MAEETPNPQLEESEGQEFVEENPITDEPEPVESEESETEESVEEDDSSNLVQSERGQKRIQELANKAKKADEFEKELESLRQRLESGSSNQNTEEILDQLRRDGIPYTGDYVKDLQLAEQRAAEKALRTFERRQSVREQFSNDVNDLEESYPELKKGSPDFDEDLTNEIVTFYKEASNLNPNLRLKTFVDRVMKVKKSGEKKAKSISVEELMSQDNSGALRPSGTTKRVNKDPKDMTLEELEEIVPR